MCSVHIFSSPHFPSNIQLKLQACNVRLKEVNTLWMNMFHLLPRQRNSFAGAKWSETNRSDNNNNTGAIIKAPTNSAKWKFYPKYLERKFNFERIKMQNYSRLLFARNKRQHRHANTERAAWRASDDRCLSTTVCARRGEMRVLHRCLCVCLR